METAILKPVYLTQKGLDRLSMELHYLCSVRRVEMAEALRETQGGGDSEDNTEYQAVRYEQLLLEMRIAELQRKISAAQLIVTGNGGGAVRLGSTITIEDEKGTTQESYLIVGSAEADPCEGCISNECPLGRAVIGRVDGELVEVSTPDGLTRYRILAVT